MSHGYIRGRDIRENVITSDKFVAGIVPVRNPDAVVSDIIYVEVDGDDVDGDGSVAKPFATISRAAMEYPVLPEFPSWHDTYIQLGLGTFYAPNDCILPMYTYLYGTRTLVGTLTVDVSTPVNTKITGNRFVMTSVGTAATVAPVGSWIAFADSTAPGDFIEGLVHHSDNSGAGGKLVVWVNAQVDDFIINVAAGTTADVNINGTNVVAPFYGTIQGSSIWWINFEVDTRHAYGGTCYFQNSSLVQCMVNIEIIPTSDFQLLLCYIRENLFWAGTSVLAEACVWTAQSHRYTGPYMSRGGSLTMVYEHAFVGTASNICCIAAGGACFLDAKRAVLRASKNVTWFLIADSVSTRDGIGGTYFLGDCIERRDISDAIVADAFVGEYAIVAVGPNRNVYVSIGLDTAVVVDGITNRVTINHQAGSIDGSGTRIVGGLPHAGGNPEIQVVTATAQTWNGRAKLVVLDSSAMGPGATFLLPAISAGLGVSDMVEVEIKNEDGTNAVAITPYLTELIDLVNAPVSTGAAKVSMKFACRASVGNWMVLAS